MNPPLVLGVDGGGTSTIAWLAGLEGPILGKGEAGPSNAKAIGPDRARQAIGLAITRAREDAGIGSQPVEVACLGLAGFDRPDDRALLERWCNNERWARQLLPANDGDLVIAAGTPEGFGIGLISGTGSIAVGRSPEGHSARAGGWGPLIGDEGSAYSVALAGLRLVARRFDGRSEAPSDDVLTHSLCQALGAESPREIVTELYGPEWDRSRIAGLARLVIEAAALDSQVLGEIIEPAAVELVSLVDTVRTRLCWELSEGEGAPPLAIAGGFLLGSDLLRGRVLDLVGSHVGPVRAVPDPVLGAVVLARRELG